MQVRRSLGLVVVLMAVLAVSFSVRAVECSEGDKQKDYRWKISDTKVVNQGQFFDTGRIEITKGYKVVGKAAAQHEEGGPGSFEISLDISKAKKQLAGKDPDKFHLNGFWVIKPPASEAQTGQKKAFRTIAGRFTAVLPFNPINEEGTVEATVTIPTWQGKFVGNEKLEGELTLSPGKPTARSK